jgi:alpha-galactosidase
MIPRRPRFSRVAVTLPVALLFLSPLPVHATDNGLGGKPLMGWSSWSSLKKGISETKIKAQADVMAAQLKSFGYEYINLDAGWRNEAGWDEFGRETWDPAKFPNGIPALAAYIHGKGLKIGIYLHPGMDLGPNSPYELNTPILGTPYHARDITDTTQWGNTNMSAYRIDVTKPGALEYIQSYADLLASWGIDYIKFDFVGPGGGNVAADSRAEMHAWTQALRSTPAGSAPIWIELSNSLNINYVSEWQQIANGWRIEGDIESGSNGFLTKWTNVLKRFTDAPKWTAFAGPGGWNDFDAVPVGNGSNDGITTDERRTAVTLWSIGCSPLILGANLTVLDNGDLPLITNSEAIAVNQAGTIATPVSQATLQQVWRVKNADGSYTVALFNLDAVTATVTAKWSDLGFSGSAKVRDLWTHGELGSYSGTFSASLASHASRLLRVTPQAGTTYEAEALPYVASGATASITADAAASGGKWLQLAGNSLNDYIEVTLPSVSAASYQLQLRYKTNNNRGKVTLKVDGVQLGGTLDQYASTVSYKSVTFGIKALTAGTHQLRLTVTGKNASSSNYSVSADAFVLVKQ